MRVGPYPVPVVAPVPPDPSVPPASAAGAPPAAPVTPVAAPTPEPAAPPSITRAPAHAGRAGPRRRDDLDEPTDRRRRSQPTAVLSRPEGRHARPRRADPAAVASLMDGRTIHVSRLFPAERPSRSPQAGPGDPQQGARDFEERGISTCSWRVGMATWTNRRARPRRRRRSCCARQPSPRVGAAEDDFSIASDRRDRRQSDADCTRSTPSSPSPCRPTSRTSSRSRVRPQPVFGRTAQGGRRPSPASASRARTVLGTFSYAKLPMVVDLEANAGSLAAHDVIAAMAGHRPAQQAPAPRPVLTSTSARPTEMPPDESSSSWTPTPPELRHQTPSSRGSDSSCRARPAPARARPSRTLSPAWSRAARACCSWPRSGPRSPPCSTG